MERKTLLTILFFSAGIIGYSQTCCSGGVPISGNLGLPPSEGNALQVSLAYDLNVLESWKNGSEDFLDDIGGRRTHSALLELGYSFTDALSVEAFLPYVWQERISTENGNNSRNETNGIGDIALLIKSRIFATQDNSTTLHLAAGPKVPTGSSNETAPNGILITADLQPGSGSWDGIFWGQFNHVTAFRPSMSFIATGTYIYKGKNNDYLGSTYQFGEEWSVIAGLSDRITIGAALFDPAVLFRYRSVLQDRFADRRLPNTGGRFLFVNPSIAYWLNPDISINTSVEVPLFVEVVGVQVSPTFRFNVGFLYRFSFKKSAPIQLFN